MKYYRLLEIIPLSHESLITIWRGSNQKLEWRLDRDWRLFEYLKCLGMYLKCYRGILYYVVISRSVEKSCGNMSQNRTERGLFIGKSEMWDKICVHDVWHAPADAEHASFFTPLISLLVVSMSWVRTLMRITHQITRCWTADMTGFYLLPDIKRFFSYLIAYYHLKSKINFLEDKN